MGLRLGQTPDFLSALCALSWLGAEIQPTASATAAEPNLASAPKLDHLFDDLTAIPAAGVAIPNHQRPLPTAPALDLRAPTQPGAPLRLNNRAWAAAYLHTAAVCHLKPADTLYAGLPLHHPLALLCALPPALIARTRLALGAPIPPEGLTTPTSIQSFSTSFWQDVRRYGASVVFLTRAMTTALLAAPPDATDRNTPVRCAILFDTPTNAARPAHDLTHRFGIPLIISAQLAPDFPAHPSPLILTPLHE